jgi:hypothetical protein
MQIVQNAIVSGGKVVLSDLPFAEGQRVNIVVAEVAPQAQTTKTIQEIRRILKGAVDRLDEPLEPMIPPGNWEMLK